MVIVARSFGPRGTDIITKPCVHGFPAAADPVDRCRRTTPLLSSRQSSSLLVSWCPPLGRLDRKRLVNKHRAPIPDAAPRLFAANYNTHHIPLIHPYHVRQKTNHRICPRLFIMRVFESIKSRRNISDRPCGGRSWCRCRYIMILNTLCTWLPDNY
jgi:hypothetical protein